MRAKRLFTWLLVLTLAGGFLYPSQRVRAEQAQPSRLGAASAYDLILAMNTLRVAYGLPALIEDPIVDAVAQATAATMATNLMSWHIGDVRDRLAAAGYGSGATVWATENFAVGTDMSIDEIMVIWSDADHMRPAVTAAYCHVGAGVARASNGATYYVLQAAYVAGQECSSTSSSGATSQPGSTSAPGSGAVSQFILPVKVATPDTEGNIYHVVQAGQSFWAIAIAYQVKIADLEAWNNLSRNTPLKTGQRLHIPDKNSVTTPTPVGMIIPSAPDADGRIVHVVQPYQALISIADAYSVPVDRILALNGLQKDWPLQVGQKLLIAPGNVTPSPTLSALQKLTPASDGNYYHIVKSGQTLSWIAGLYAVPLASLMAWNGLDSAAIIRPEQKLLLLVTPPATPTPTPAPATLTLSPTLAATQPTPAPTPTPGVTTAPGAPASDLQLGVAILAGLLVIGGLFWWGVARQKARSG